VLFLFVFCFSVFFTQVGSFLQAVFGLCVFLFALCARTVSGEKKWQFEDGGLVICKVGERSKNRFERTEVGFEHSAWRGGLGNTRLQ
jgi:hypothetical protein